MKPFLQVIQGDITALSRDAIVNAANSSLLGGGGVDGAIHRAAGPELLAECRLLGGCKPGLAKITGGYQLPAKHIVHTVGPIWNDGSRGEKETLKSCYLNSLERCRERDLKSVAFPCIATGVYRFPPQLAAKIAVDTCRAFVHEHPIEVTFCCFSASDLEIYTELLQDEGEEI